MPAAGESESMFAALTFVSAGGVHEAGQIRTLKLGSWKLVNVRARIASIGHDVHSGEDAPLALISYCGVQLLYDRRRSMRFGSRLLRENQDQGDDHDQQRQRGGVTAESQPSFRDRLIEKVADDGSERASQDKGGPK